MVHSPGCLENMPKPQVSSLKPKKASSSKREKMKNRTSKLRTGFHQAKWDEEVIFELHREGERGILVPEVEEDIKERVGDGITAVPHSMLRTDPPKLPEIGQMRVLKHFLLRFFFN